MRISLPEIVVASAEADHAQAAVAEGNVDDAAGDRHGINLIGELVSARFLHRTGRLYRQCLNRRGQLSYVVERLVAARTGAEVILQLATFSHRQLAGSQRIDSCKR
jgi:hypothetical protein